MKFDKILIPVDFSESSLAASRAAADIARMSGGKLILLHVPDLADGIALDRPIRPEPGAAPIPLHEYFELLFRDDFAPLREELDELLMDVLIHPAPRPEVGIIRVADEHDIDLIVMGTHGREGFQRLLMGSVTDTVIRQSRYPVLVIRNAAQQD